MAQQGGTRMSPVQARLVRLFIIGRGRRPPIASQPQGTRSCTRSTNSSIHLHVMTHVHLKTD
eukprot:7042315-Prymnesium_polylepis.1